jgi:hypothetical protein
MMRGCRYLVLVFVGLQLFLACKPTDPPQYIQPDEMEDILYDYHVAQGMAMGVEGNPYNSHLYYEAVLKKHHVTSEQFDSSLHYYYYRSDRFIDIYKRVQERLSDEALLLGASVSEVERYMTQSTSGDTTDIWEGGRRRVLVPFRPYNYLQFRVKGDTAFHAGDSFLMTFANTFLTQGSPRGADAYLAVTYMNDSVVTRNQPVSGFGVTTMVIPACQQRVKEICGYIVLNQHLDNNQSNDICLLSLDHIQLVRFHHHDDEKTKTDSVKTDTTRTAVTPRADSVQTERTPFGRPRRITKF